MRSRRLALSLAKQLRTCPPPYVRGVDPGYAAALEQHIAICPYCSSGLSDDQDQWDMVADRIADRDAGAQPAPPEPGQLRNIRTDQGTWRDGYFYNPPCVLILDFVDPATGGISVAQTYHDISLAAPGDLILTAEQTAADSLFIECWHTYTLMETYLGPVVGRIDPQIVAAVRELENEPDALPQWAALPRPMTENDPRVYFRELEVEVGYTFAARAGETILARLEGTNVRLAFASVSQAMAAFSENLPDVSWPFEPKNIEAVFSTAKLPDAEYRKAAAGEDGAIAQVNLVVLDDGTVGYMKAVPVQLHLARLDSDILAVSGKIAERLPEYPLSELLCCLSLEPGTEIVMPGKADWDENEGLFYAEFDVPAHMEFVPHIAVIFQSSPLSG